MSHYTVRYTDETRLCLTTENPGSHDTILVLRSLDCDCPDMGPADTLCLHAEPQDWRDVFGVHTAAEIVRKWALLHDPSQDAYTTAELFLSQWPQGPQLRP